MDRNFIVQAGSIIAKWASKIEEKVADIFSRFRSRKIEVETEVKGVEKVEEAKRELESLPETKMVEVKVKKKGDMSDLGLTGKETGETIPEKPESTGLPDSPVERWSKMPGVLRSVCRGFSNLVGGLKEVTGYLVSSGGGTFILAEGFKSLVKIGVHFYNSWIDGMKEAAEVSERNAGSIREAAAANEELRQKGDSYLKQLEQYSSQESLSNANKTEATKIIGELTKAYGDLGIKLDETTGKLTGVDSAMIRKGEKDKARRIRELEAELKEIENENAQQAELRDKAGIPVWFGGDLRLGGQETIEAATRKIQENQKRAGEIRRLLHAEWKKDPGAEIRSKREAEVADLEARNREQRRAFEQKKADDAFAEARTPEEKIANRQAVLKRHREEKLKPLEEKVAQARMAMQNASGNDLLEAKRNLLQLEKELQAEREKAYAWERQIRDVQKQQAEELSRRKPETAEKSDTLRSNIRDKAQDLKWQAMERSGQDKAAAEERALRDAERTKGGRLTGEEAAQVRKLSELTWNMNDQQAPQFGDLAVQTNSLTSRGGFSGGAVTADSEKIAREACNYNKRQAETADKIMRFLEDMERN